MGPKHRDGGPGIAAWLTVKQRGTHSALAAGGPQAPPSLWRRDRRPALQEWPALQCPA